MERIIEMSGKSEQSIELLRSSIRLVYAKPTISLMSLNKVIAGATGSALDDDFVTDKTGDAGRPGRNRKR